ncbi:tryptophan 7-halogenase [Luteolibacter flavescens]|uniref:Tryptophan 7-halogenase n=1 Tax=Luteolibacter flavescens TaxID=1859460 RepID=A0ABT3FKI9_9BACT|nr:tryptophan 7-halogenase [Luteolibacter flavescens]MCW1884087.1 tryptophan 7-halogenase [Luteolibacter flavescens]
MIQNVLVLGAGSAGLIAALSIKKKIPQLNVRVVRSPDIGVIGVGEGTTPNFPRHIFDYLGISRKHFYELAEPTWKLGIRFLWGERGRFDYTFAPQLDAHWTDLPRPNGFYCDDEFSDVDITSALMRQGKAFPRQPNGAPDIQPWHAFHIENAKFVEILEVVAREVGVEFTDGRVTGADRGPQGITAVHLEDGRKLEADFFIDASGFRSELIGKALEEPFESFDKTLFCDRAVVGGWERSESEPILPYTTAEQMDAGWAWQIEHEFHVNRGYVYSSQAISDDEAAAEFKRKNPKVPESPRIVKFRSGCYKRLWVDNVIAVGNSGGFVEPLEATALMIVCTHCQTFVDFLLHSELDPTPSMRDLYNEIVAQSWYDIRDFLGLHYKLNTALDTPFWKHCRADTDLSGIGALLDFYEENGPTGFCRYRMGSSQNDFGIEGYFVMLVGNRAPYRKRHTSTAQEKAIWEAHRQANAARARQGIDVKEALHYVRHPGWQWNADKPA